MKRQLKVLLVATLCITMLGGCGKRFTQSQKDTFKQYRSQLPLEGDVGINDVTFRLETTDANGTKSSQKWFGGIYWFDNGAYRFFGSYSTGDDPSRRSEIWGNAEGSKECVMEYETYLYPIADVTGFKYKELFDSSLFEDPDTMGYGKEISDSPALAAFGISSELGDLSGNMMAIDSEYGNFMTLDYICTHEDGSRTTIGIYVHPDTMKEPAYADSFKTPPDWYAQPVVE